MSNEDLTEKEPLGLILRELGQAGALARFKFIGVEYILRNFITIGISEPITLDIIKKERKLKKKLQIYTNIIDEVDKIYETILYFRGLVNGL